MVVMGSMQVVLPLPIAVVIIIVIIVDVALERLLHQKKRSMVMVMTTILWYTNDLPDPVTGFMRVHIRQVNWRYVFFWF